jgi:hypothetical protein
MLDPSFDCYVKNKEDEILDIFEIRESLSNQEYIMHNRLENINKIEYKYAAPKEPLKIPNIKNKRVYHGNSI